MEVINECGESILSVQFGQDKARISAHEVDKIIETLGLVRAELEPAVPFEIERHHQFPLETRPEWRVIVDPKVHGALLFFRHSGYGWTGFAVPYESLKKLLALDVRQAFPAVSRSMN